MERRREEAKGQFSVVVCRSSRRRVLRPAEQRAPSRERRACGGRREARARPARPAPMITTECTVTASVTAPSGGARGNGGGSAGGSIAEGRERRSTKRVPSRFRGPNDEPQKTWGRGLRPRRRRGVAAAARRRLPLPPHGGHQLAEAALGVLHVAIRLRRWENIVMLDAKNTTPLVPSAPRAVGTPRLTQPAAWCATPWWLRRRPCWM